MAQISYCKLGMKQGVLVLLLAIIAIPLVGASHTVSERATVANLYGSQTDPTSAFERKVQKEMLSIVEEALKNGEEQGVFESASEAPPENANSVK